MDRVCLLIILAEFLVLPIWAGLVASRGLRPAALLLRAPAAAIVLILPILLLAVLAPGLEAVVILKAQAVAVGFSLLIAAFGALFRPATRPLLAQYATTIFGWFLIGSVLCLDIFLPFVSTGARPAVIQSVTCVNPLLAVGPLVNFDWTHAPIFYRWAGLGEHYQFVPPAWWLALLINLIAAAALTATGLIRVRRRSA